LNKIAALNNYLIRSIVDPNDSLPDLNQSNIYKEFRTGTEPRLMNNYSSFFSSPSDSFLNIKPQNCKKCETQPYLDLLKYELAKRIELQVAKGKFIIILISSLKKNYSDYIFLQKRFSFVKL